MKRLAMVFGWVLFIFCPLIVSGCATVHVQTADCEATYSTVFKDIDAAQFSVCGGSADVVQSSVNLDALKALSAAIGALAK